MQVASNKPACRQTEHNYTCNKKCNTIDGITNLHEDMVTHTTHAIGHITTEDNMTRDGKTPEEDKPCWMNSGPQVSRMMGDNSSTITLTIETPSNEQYQQTYTTLRKAYV